MQLLTALTFATTFSAAAILMYAGLAKALYPAATAQTLTRLGLPLRVANFMAAALPVWEVLTAILLVTLRSWPAAILTCLLAVMFAGAGVRAMHHGEGVECRCFGAVSGGRLGRRQLVLLPAWLAVCAAAAVAQPLRGSAAVAALCALFGAVATAALVRLAPDLRTLRRLRLGMGS